MIQKGFVARTRMCEATVRSHRPEPDRRPMADAHADAARDTCIVQWLYVLGEPGNGHGAVQGPGLVLRIKRLSQHRMMECKCGVVVS